MVDPIDEFIKRLKVSADEARLRKRDLKPVVFAPPRKPQKQIPIALFHDMFGDGPNQSTHYFRRLTTR